MEEVDCCPLCDSLNLWIKAVSGLLFCRDCLWTES